MGKLLRTNNLNASFWIYLEDWDLFARFGLFCASVVIGRYLEWVVWLFGRANYTAECLENNRVLRIDL